MIENRIERYQLYTVDETSKKLKRFVRRKLW